MTTKDAEPMPVQEPALPDALKPHVDWHYWNEVGPGWTPLLLRLHAALSALNPQYRLLQVKEKFGTLRVYLPQDVRAHAPEAMRAAIARAVEESAVTCEVCGSPGTLLEPEWRVACPECAKAPRPKGRYGF